MSVDDGPGIAYSPPLRDVRVVDLTNYWAGPVATRQLADLGAEVIRIESPKRLDPARYQILADNDVSGEFWQRGWWNWLNRGKRSIGLDLTTESARDTVRDLVRVSDVVVENFSTRVMKNFGFSYEDFRLLNPRLVMASSSAFGRSGPWADFSSFGSKLEFISGVASLAGYPDDVGWGVGSFLSDPPSGMALVSAIVSALLEREASGEGKYIDMAMLESILTLASDGFVALGSSGRVPSREGNGNPSAFAQGCYPCREERGEEQWVVISAVTREHWEQLCLVIGHREWLEDDRFTDLQSCGQHAEEIEEAVSAWTRERRKSEVMRLLQEQGVPSGAVLTTDETFEDPHIIDRSYFRRFPISGKQDRPMPGRLIRMNSANNSVGLAPSFAEANEYVLREILEYSDEKISDLRTTGAVADAPTDVAQPERVSIDTWVSSGVAVFDSSFQDRLEHALEQSDKAFRPSG